MKYNSAAAIIEAAVQIKKDVIFLGQIYCAGYGQLCLKASDGSEHVYSTIFGTSFG